MLDIGFFIFGIWGASALIALMSRQLSRFVARDIGDWADPAAIFAGPAG